MGDLIRSAIMYAAVMALIILGLHFYKQHQSKVTIEPSDHSMEPQYSGQGYNLDTDAARASDFKTKDAIAYWVPGEPETEKVAWVVATEGQRVSMEKSTLKVDGQPFEIKPEIDKSFPEIRVPHGCVFVVSTKPVTSKDSLTVGPIPYHNIKGRLP